MGLQREISETQSLPPWAANAILNELDGGLIITTIDGSFRRMNREAARIYGFDKPEDFERHLQKLTNIFELRTYPQRRLVPFREWPMTRLRHGTRSVHSKLYVKRRDTKQERLVEYYGKQIRRPDGSAAFAMLGLRDISIQESARQAMRLDRERLQLAQKAGRIGTFEWQIPENILHWSEEMEELYGLKPGTFSSRPDDWRKTLIAEDGERVDRLIQRVFANRQRHFETEWRAILPDKSVRNLMAKAEIDYSPEGTPLRMLGINMDITERRRAAEAYKASLDRQSAFFKTALDAIMTVDEQGQITEFNPAAERIFGYSRSQVVGKSIVDLVPQELNTAHYTNAGKRGINGESRILDQQLEVVARRKNGEKFPAELFLTRIGDTEPPVYMGTLRDITQRKRAEQELRASEQRFRFMAESMPTKIFTAQPNGKIDYVNPGWFEYLGKANLEDINLAGWNSFVHPEDIVRVSKAWRHAIRTGDDYRIEQRIRNKDDQYLWHLTTARAMHDEQGNIIKWIGSYTNIEDIRRRQELEERAALLTEQHEQLMMINRAKDEFISLASHQLRTPATGVKQYIGMLIQGYFGDLTDDQLTILKSAYDSNERQLGIINALLNVARLDAGKVRFEALTCDMSALLRSVVDEQSEVFHIRRQHLQLQLPAKRVICRVDSQLIRMVLENIIDNAGKYSPDGKTVTVSLSQTKRDTLISIQDQGVGMRKQDQQKLFQKFSRIDNELSTTASGSGLGLYWAKKIMDLHGGTIEVESRPKHGSTFTVRIPRQKPASAGNLS